MIRRHPPHKMLSLLVIMLAMLGYFSFELYSRNQAKVKPGIPEINNITSPEKENAQNQSNSIQSIPNTQVEGGRPENTTIRPGAVIIMEKKFLTCGHTDRRRIEAPHDLVNLTEEQLKLAYKNWIIKKFSPEEITIYQDIKGKCPNHFVLKDKDGLVAVYYQSLVNGITLKEVTPIPVGSLPAKDKEKLKTGIRIESMQELAQVLEDLGS